MNKDEFKAKFKTAGEWAARFHAGATRILSEHPVTFWPVVALTIYGLIRVFV